MAFTLRPLCRDAGRWNPPRTGIPPCGRIQSPVSRYRLTLSPLGRGALAAATAATAATARRCSRTTGATSSRFPHAVEVEIHVAPSCSLRLIEASVDWQETLIEEACNEEDETCVEADPYGMAVWPAAQVLAQAAAAYGLRAQGSGERLRALELGCGCGLASLALLSLDMEVVATDFRELPLQLLQESAARLGVAERLETQLLDLRDHGQPLPKAQADIVLASDVLYEKQTAEAMAQRVVEARQQNCAVLISDIGRPNRKVFIEKLAGLRPEESSEFASSGTAVQRVGGTEAGRTKVELLELPANGPASEALAQWPPAVLSRPSNHGHVL
ncbi:unnamed protein product [Symbiodinium sp. CCMP2456]|nr:unnamed protein product [Symbiodinium sp. CCMP2456]